MLNIDSPTLVLLADAARPFVSVAGAAFAANSFITALRQNNPLPQERPVSLPYRVLYAPRYARILAIVFAVVISIGCSALVALAAGQPVALSIDTALSAVLAALGSQLIHGLSLSAEVPAPAAAEELAEPILTDAHLDRLNTIMGSKDLSDEEMDDLMTAIFRDQYTPLEFWLVLDDGTEVVILGEQEDQR